MWSYLWQNFLIDSKIRSYIAEHIAKMYTELWCEALIEIGPGKGAITKLISGVSDNFFVIEKDDSLIQNLECIVQNWTIIQWDVLEVDVEKMLEAWSICEEREEARNVEEDWGNSVGKIDTRKTLVVGNLPYYITSPILRKFFGEGRQDYAWWIFMLQDEVGQKLRSDAKKKSYLRWIINYAYEVTYLKWVPAKCFNPAPKVKSCLVQLTTKSEELKISWNSFLSFLELYAPFSRKTLGSIATLLEKRDGKSILSNSRKVEEDRGKLWKKTSLFSIPEDLKKKRLEELDSEELSKIIK